jgi:hypothetical protein
MGLVGTAPVIVRSGKGDAYREVPSPEIAPARNRRAGAAHSTRRR